MNNLYEALEVCLESIDHGMDFETSLARYPDIADELRPILEASMNAKEMAVLPPSADVVRRNRAKFLHRAAEMREAQVKSASAPNWLNSLRRAAIALAVLVITFISGTSLVRASSNTLPGDNFYLVKRTWEDVSLLFTFDSARREALEVEHENNRLQEVQELFAKGRSAEVDFAGIVTRQDGDEWLVSGIRIVISSQTDLHDGPVFVEDAVRVFGVLQSDGSVLVERIDQLSPNAKLPEIENSDEGSEDHSNSGTGSSQDDNDNNSANENDSSGPGNDNINNSGPGGNDNENTNSSGPSGATDNINENNSGSGGGNGNSNDSNSGSGSGDNSSTEDSSGSGSGSDNSNDSNSGGGGDD